MYCDKDDFGMTVVIALYDFSKDSCHDLSNSNLIALLIVSLVGYFEPVSNINFIASSCCAVVGVLEFTALPSKSMIFAKPPPDLYNFIVNAAEVNVATLNFSFSTALVFALLAKILYIS